MVCGMRVLRHRNESRGGTSQSGSLFAASSGRPSALLPGDLLPTVARTRYSGLVETIFSVLEVLFAVILIFLVLMHSGKDSGLSGAFGVGSGTGPLGGGSLVERNLNRWTIFFAVIFFLNAFLLLKAPWA
jgi:preprotein translocase subunit SecG